MKSELIIAAIIYAMFTILGATIPIVGSNMLAMSEHFVAPLTVISLFVSANALGRVFTSYASGVISDKMGRKNILLGSIALMGVFYILLPLTSNIYIGMFLILLAGMGQGMLDSTGVAMLFDLFKEKANLAVGYVQVFVCIGIFLSPTISSFLYEGGIFFGYYFFALGILSIIVFVAMIFTPFPSMTLPSGDSVSGGGQGSKTEGIIIGLSVFLFSIFLATLTTWVSTYSAEVVGLSTSMSIRVLTAYSIGCIIGGIIISKLLARIHASVFYALNPIGILIPLVIYSVFRSQSTALFLFVIVGFFSGIIIGLALAITGELFPEKTAAASGAVMTAAAIGTLITPIVTNLIFDSFGIEAVYNFMLIILVCFMMSTVIFRARYNNLKPKTS